MWNVLNFDGSPENRIYGCLKAIINITPLWRMKFRRRWIPCWN
jgi:hypothetical protein